MGRGCGRLVPRVVAGRIGSIEVVADANHITPVDQPDFMEKLFADFPK